MNTIKLYFAIGCLLLLASSCTKVIDLKLGNVSGRLVIEGNVTNAAGPQVIKLSTNVPFTNTNTYPPVTGATVTVTDQAGNSFSFTEGPSGTYSNSVLTGIPGNTYTMTVITGGVTYTAVSTMPPLIPLDSLTAENQPASSGSKPKKQVSVYYRDPAGVANQYRFVEYVNGVQVKDVFTDNDQFNDGLKVKEILQEDDIDIYSGNTVKVEMQCIDHPIYIYWLSLLQQEDNGPGGAATPSDPPTNIVPASLGYFSAHTTQTQTIVVK